MRLKIEFAVLLALVLFALGMGIASLTTGAPAAGESVEGGAGRFPCTVASITDGDTLRCRETDQDGRQIRVRVSGINARETDGTCSPGHPCPDATASAATAALRRLASGQVLLCRAVGMSYRRVAAFCSNEAGTDLSCAMVASGTAARWDRHWGRHRCS